MKFYVVAFLLIVIYFPCFTQDSGGSKVDSLINKVKTLPDDTLKVNTLIQLGSEYLNTNLDEALRYGTVARDIADKINFANGEGYALKLMGQAHARKGNYPSATEQFKASLDMFKKVNNKDGESNILNNLGSIYFNIGDDSTGISYHLRSLKIAEEINNKFRISTNLNNIGSVYANKPATIDIALSYFLRALPIFEEINYSDGVGIASMNIGEIYFNKGNYDSAILFFERSLKVYGDTPDASFLLSYMGQISAKKSDFGKALNFHNQAIEIADKNGAKFELVLSLLSLGKTQDKMGDVKHSIETNQKALKMAKEINARIEIKKAYEMLSKLYADLQDFNNAYRYEKLLTSIKDTLFNSNEDRKMQQLQFQQDLIKEQFAIKAEGEKRILAIQNQKAINYFIFIGIIGVLIISGLTIRFFQIRKLNRDKHKANVILESTLNELKSTQSQLIQSEKMASLGELTAGIAHEIQNPLNFVNNFSELNKELISELRTEIKNGNIGEVNIIVNDIETNEEKINHHGKRADSIVKGMLQHSRSSTGVKELTDINALTDEYLRLTYHGLRAKDKSFTAMFQTDYDQSISKINVIPQDMGRVILNLINNAFYTVNEKKKQNIGNYEPTVCVSTKKSVGKILISVKDNGNGIQDTIKEKIFQPFFTTKPTGQGTGLGLSLSYDIVKAHGGELKVETKVGEGSEFVIYMPA